MTKSRFDRIWSAALIVFGLLALLPSEARPDPRQWSGSGKPIRQGHHIEWQRASYRRASDGKTLVVWSDTRDGTRDVWGQLINAQGIQEWGSGGRCIVTYDSRQEDPEVVAVNGGWIVAWIDFRTDTAGDVWAQKIDDQCTPLWDPTGVLVDSLIYSVVTEMTVRAAHDGQGGAIIAWEDVRRRDAGDIFAQRVTSTGQRAWPNPLRVTDIEGGQVGITADSDGQGNLLLAWKDGRTPSDDNIYAAKVTPDGQTPWGANGRIVCNTVGPQHSVKLCPDGRGGCYLTWLEGGETIANDIYAQRLNADGQPMWTTNGIAVCNDPADQLEVRVAISVADTGADGMITVWRDARATGVAYEIYVQKITPQGLPAWTVNGVKVCGDGINTREGGRLTSDLHGGIICAWEDTRNTDGVTDECDLWAGRVLANGTLAWNGTNGVEVGAGAGQQFQPLLRMDDGDGVVIIYADSRLGSQILRFMNLNLTNGVFTLNPDSCWILYGLDKDANYPRIVSMSPRRAGIVWEDNRYVWGGFGLFYQIVDDTAGIVMQINGDTLAPDNEDYGSYSQSEFNMCPDGQNGFFTVWKDGRLGISRIRITRVGSNGELTHSRRGELVWHNWNGQSAAVCSPDGQGGCYVAWSGYDPSYRKDAFVMRMNGNLTPAWTDAVRLTDTTPDDVIAGIVTTSDNACIVVWRSGASAISNISAAKIGYDGTIAWNQDVCAAINQQTDAAIVSDNQGGAYFAWSDYRTPVYDSDVYAQHVGHDGAALWGADGIVVMSDSLNQNKPQIALDMRGNIYVAWNDYRSGTNQDIYAQKLSPAGIRLWPVEGKPIATAAGEQYTPALLTEWDNGVYMLWTDNRGFYRDIYGTHIDSNGVEADTPDDWWVPQDGGVICGSYDDQEFPAVAADETAGVFAVWADERASGKEPLKNIWGNRINDGTVSVSRIESPVTPGNYSLEQNYPNPFNPSTSIVFSIPRNDRVELSIYNTLGQQVSTLIDRVLTAGQYQVQFNAKALASGQYFYRLKAGDFTDVKKMTVLK